MNKATRKLRWEIARASRKGRGDVQREKPAYNWHSLEKPSFVTQTFPTATPDGTGLVSSSRRRNMCQRVLVNTGENGKRFSQTVHEPLVAGEYITYKNHSYIDYRQPGVGGQAA